MNRFHPRALLRYHPGQAMDALDRASEYLAKALEAEEHAAKAVDPLTRSSFLQVAFSYRDLAAFALAKSIRETSGESPSLNELAAGK